MDQLIIVWNISEKFDIDMLKRILNRVGLKEREPGEYMLASWKSNTLTLNLFKKTLVVQGKKTDENTSLLGKIHSIDGLTLIDKYRKAYAKLQPKPNAILCDKCGSPTYSIEARAEKFDLVFTNECGHANRMEPPFRVLNTRILPDLNIIVGNSLSRYINLGFFNGFEIVLPDFLVHAIDNFLGRKERSGALNELENLKKHKNEMRIDIYNPPSDHNLKKLKREEFESQEDDIILQLANQTNSILLTSDKGLKTKASLKNRPVIFIPPKVDSKLKFIEKVRLGN